MGERLAGDGVENPKSTGVPSTEAECWGFPPRPQLGIWGQLEMARIGLGAGTLQPAPKNYDDD